MPGAFVQTLQSFLIVCLNKQDGFGLSCFKEGK
jgi:hypothetical protein